INLGDLLRSRGIARLAKCLVLLGQGAQEEPRRGGAQREAAQPLDLAAESRGGTEAGRNSTHRLGLLPDGDPASLPLLKARHKTRKRVRPVSPGSVCERDVRAGT